MLFITLWKYFSLFPKIVEIQALVKCYDLDQDGHICYEQFIRGLREPLNTRRAKIVYKVFGQIDRSSRGSITAEDLLLSFNFMGNRDFQEGKKSREEVLEEFLQNFEGFREGSSISHEEFVDFYCDISMTITSDEQFVKRVEQSWFISEDEEASVIPAQLEQLV